MRKPTREETDRWLTVAREHGLVGKEGAVQLGRFVVEGSDEEPVVYVQFITPLPASIYSDCTGEPTGQPVPFERTAAGEIILPGRWWAAMLDTLSGQRDVPPDQRQTASFASRRIAPWDVFLPAETDTIAILAPNHNGDLVWHEALRPGTRCILSLQAS